MHAISACGGGKKKEERNEEYLKTNHE